MGPFCEVIVAAVFPVFGFFAGEEGGDDRVAEAADGVEGLPGFPEHEAEGGFVDRFVGVLDLAAQFEGLPDTLPEEGLEKADGLLRLPEEGGDLVFAQADEGIAAFEGMVHEGEGVVPGEGDEPEGEFGEVHRHGVLVHAVEAALRHAPAGEEDFVLVGRDDGQATVMMPRLDEFIGELAARFHEEGAGAHGGVTDLEGEDLFRRGDVAQWFQQPERGADNGSVSGV